MNKTVKVFQVGGMTCSGCEKTIIRVLKKKEGVLDVSVSLARNEADVTYDSEKISQETISETIRAAGYEVKGVGNATVPIKKGSDILKIVGVSIFLLAVYAVGQKTGLLNFIPQVDQKMGYGILFVIGILTSLHCLVMCGGINISQNMEAEGSTVCVPAAANFKKKFNISRFRSSFLYNSGRVVSYTIIGGIIGAVGSVLSLTPASKAAITIIAGVLMAFIGLRMTGVFSFMHKIKLPVPKKLQNISLPKLNKYGPFAVGLLNGFMPCAPLQGMQIYALGSGSFMSGALSMFFFSLGTFPLMFGLGTLVTFLSHKMKGTMVKTGAVLVIFLGLVMVNRGISLSGRTLLPAAAGTSTADVQDGVQVIRSVFTANGYAPITVQKGIPVKWIITIKEEDLNGCNGTMVVPEYRINKKLSPGENVVTFTPVKTGTIGYSCWMGMIRSSITIVDGQNGSVSQTQTNSDTQLPTAAPVTDADIFISKGVGIEEVIVHVSATGYTPRMIVLKRNTKAHFKFIVDQLSGCNAFVVFPEYQGGLDLSKGQTKTPDLSITQDFHIRCGMGMLNATVRVVDDLSKIDREAVKKEAASIVSSQGGGCCSIRAPQ